MRTRLNSLADLMAAATIAAIGAGLDVAGPLLRKAGGGSSRRPTPPRTNTALQREIDEWNRAVDRRKAKKKAEKLARRQARERLSLVSKDRKA